jgi:hypothetical protein
MKWGHRIELIRARSTAQVVRAETGAGKRARVTRTARCSDGPGSCACRALLAVTDATGTCVALFGAVPDFACRLAPRAARHATFLAHKSEGPRLLKGMGLWKNIGLDCFIDGSG